MEVYNNDICDLLAKDSCTAMSGVRREVLTTKEEEDGVPADPSVSTSLLRGPRLPVAQPALLSGKRLVVVRAQDACELFNLLQNSLPESQFKQTSKRMDPSSGVDGTSVVPVSQTRDGRTGSG